MKLLNAVNIGGQEILPLIEGGKGVAVSNGLTAGAWAAAGGVGTFSAANADSYDAQGQIISQVYYGKTRRERHLELINYGIQGGIAQARIAHEVSNSQGRVHMNVLWEMGGCEQIMHGILSKAKGLVQGVTGGAGMPYRMADICAQYNVHYYPIVSSARAFKALWRRSYHKFSEWLGAVVYEDPWRAGGHNGITTAEDPNVPQDPYARVLALRQTLKEYNLDYLPIIMAGGVWWLSEWQDWIDNKELGPIAFQFGTRPLLTQESPISGAWKEKLLQIKEGDIILNKFSPTGFYSSAVLNPFLEELIQRSNRQIPYTLTADRIHNAPLSIGARGRTVYVKSEDVSKAHTWHSQGFTATLRTPDNTLIYVTPEKENEILIDQINCMGCLSACNFSNWSQHEPTFSTGRRADPRSFCIQKTLQDAAHTNSIDHNLMFSGHNAYRFGSDPYYSNNFIPSVKQLVEQIQTGY